MKKISKNCIHLLLIIALVGCSKKEGWVKSGNDWYYYDSSGRKITRYSGSGREIIDGKVYEFDEKGRMLTGFIDSDGYTRYYDDNGIAEGWKQIDNNWYYFLDDGTYAMMKSQYLNIGNDTYYFDYNGIMQTNRWAADYYLGEDGKAIKNKWMKIDGKDYYFDANGIVDKNKKYEEKKQSNNASKNNYDDIFNHEFNTNIGKLINNCLQHIYDYSVGAFANSYDASTTKDIIKREFDVAVDSYYTLKDVANSEYYIKGESELFRECISDLQYCRQGLRDYSKIFTYLSFYD